MQASVIEYPDPGIQCRGPAGNSILGLDDSGSSVLPRDSTAPKWKEAYGSSPHWPCHPLAADCSGTYSPPQKN